MQGAKVLGGWLSQNIPVLAQKRLMVDALFATLIIWDLCVNEGIFGKET